MSDWTMMGYVLVSTGDIFLIPFFLYITVIPVVATLYYLIGYLREICSLSASEIWKSLWKILFAVLLVIMFFVHLHEFHLWPFD